MNEPNTENYWKERALHFEQEFDAANKEIIYLQSKLSEHPVAVDSGVALPKELKLGKQVTEIYEENEGTLTKKAQDLQEQISALEYSLGQVENKLFYLRNPECTQQHLPLKYLKEHSL